MLLNLLQNGPSVIIFLLQFKVHHFTIGKTGVLSSIPYLARVLCAIGFGFLGDFLFKKKILSAGAARKWFSIFCK